VWDAVVFGVLASSALVIGGALGSYWRAPTRVTGVLLAFASGTLVSALAFELFPDAVHLGGLVRAGSGLVTGALTFVLINTWLDSKVAQPSPADGRPVGTTEPEAEPATPARAEAAAAAQDRLPDLPGGLSGAALDQRDKVRAASQGVGLALLAAVTLDGVPENLALGVSLAAEGGGGGGTLALLVAIFASNFPEALVGAVAMRSQGRPASFAIGLWFAAAVLLALAVVAGRMVLAGAQDVTLAFPLAFAGGAVLASLADTLMPEAFERGRPLNSFATAAGFFASFVLAEL
jgi:zinc transporter, ZIP family